MIFDEIPIPLLETHANPPSNEALAAQYRTLLEKASEQRHLVADTVVMESPLLSEDEDLPTGLDETVVDTIDLGQEPSDLESGAATDEDETPPPLQLPEEEEEVGFGDDLGDSVSDEEIAQADTQLYEVPEEGPPPLASFQDSEEALTGDMPVIDDEIAWSETVVLDRSADPEPESEVEESPPPILPATKKKRRKKKKKRNNDFID